MAPNAGEDNSGDNGNGRPNPSESHELLKSRDSSSPEPEGAAILDEPEGAAMPTKPEGAAAQDKPDAETKPTQTDPGEGLLPPSANGILAKIMPIIAIIIQIAVIVWLIVILVHAIWLSGVDHTLSNSDKYLYNTGIAALAHLMSAFTIGQIRNLWLKDLTEGSRPRASRLSRTRVLLSIGTFEDNGKAFEMVFSLLAFGLFSTAFIGAMTITQVPRQYTKLGELFGGANAPPTGCWSITTSPDPSVLAWNNFGSDGTFFALNESNPDSFCPPALFTTIRNTNTALDTASAPDGPGGPGPGAGGYVGFGNSVCQGALGGVVDCSAIGALVSTYPTCDILRPFNCTTFPLGTSACLPVFGSSSVSCSTAGLISSNQGLITGITTGSCSIGTNNGTGATPNSFLVNSTLSDQMIGACTSNSTVGDMTILIGSVDSSTSQRLALLMNDTAASQNASEYSVACTLNLNEANFDFKVVSHFTDVPASYLDGHTNVLNSTGETCNPSLQQATLNTFEIPAQGISNKSDVLNDNSRATAAVMLFQLFNQPLFNAINFGNGKNLTIPNAFSSSNNQLEDFLGVTVASYMSYYWSIGIDFRDEAIQSSPAFQQSVLGYPVLAQVPEFRIGSGKAWQVVYLIPSILCLIALVLLLFKSKTLTLPKRD